MGKTAEKYAELNIKKRKIADLVPHPSNPRFHPESQIDLIVEKMSDLGYYKSVVIQKNTNYILAGHGVIASLKKAGYTHVDVSEVDHPEKWALALMAYDNKVGELSFWDQPNLIALETELHEMDVEMSELGFESWEIDSNKGEGQDPNELWEDMPEFEQEDAMGVRMIKVRFQTLSAVDEFAELLRQNITDKTRYIWFPKLANLALKDFECIDDES